MRTFFRNDRTLAIAVTVLALDFLPADAEPGDKRISEQTPSERQAPQGEAMVAPVKRMTPQMPKNVAVPDDKPGSHKRKPKKARN